MIADAIGHGATDVHFIPDESGYFIQYRIMGNTSHQEKLDSYIAERLVSHFKYQSGMDISERRKPQSTSMKIDLNNVRYDLRISTLPTRLMESLAIRIIPQNQYNSLEELPLFMKHLHQLETSTQLTQGLCLITGPTGSGKTTTLYAMLEKILEEKNRTIITIEDPIERTIERTIQVEINHKAGLTFANCLRAALRHDPDVIMVGEIRDEETAALAIRASLTGHLVLATLHSKNCYQAVLRMLDYGVSKFDLNEACQMIVSQRLVHTPRYYEMDIIKRNRSALFEWLVGEQLSRAILTSERIKYRTLFDEARKAWCLGFITTDSLKEFE